MTLDNKMSPGFPAAQQASGQVGPEAVIPGFAGELHSPFIPMRGGIIDIEV